MSYPERGANYDHKPRFIERMKRAEGGDVSVSTAQGENLQSVDAPLHLLRPSPQQNSPWNPADVEQAAGRTIRKGD